MYSRKDSGFEGYVGSNISTPKMVNNKIMRMRTKKDSNLDNPSPSQHTIFKDLVSRSKEKSMDDDDPILNKG